MISICFASSCALLSLKPLPHFFRSLPKLNHHTRFLIKGNILKKKGICRAELSSDAPFAAAIGACMLSSLFLPKAVNTEEDGDSALDSTDARLTAMGIISFIPYFNWLSWVFAWLDTGKRRYAVYALVYLAPYLRSNMSLSPEESWVPVASIVLGIIHVQLEASIKNGDLEGFQFFKEAAKFLSPIITRRKDDMNLKDHQGLFEEVSLYEGAQEHEGLPSAEERRNEFPKSGVQVPRRKSSKHPEKSNGGWDDEEEERKKL